MPAIAGMVARPQSRYGGTDPSWQAKWWRVLNQPFSSTGCVTPRAQTHTHTEHTCAYTFMRTLTRTIKSNGVCPVAGRESPPMSGSHNDIIAVDGACWGILFHTIGMLQTSTRTTRRWWWQKSAWAPDLLVDNCWKLQLDRQSWPLSKALCYYSEPLKFKADSSIIY